jgi:hypothetical protein
MITRPSRSASLNWYSLADVAGRIILWSSCPGDALMCRSGTGTECWCCADTLIFPVVRVFLLVVCLNLCFGSRLRRGLWKGQSSIGGHEQFGSYYGQVPLHWQSRQICCKEAAQPAIVTIQANTNPRMRATGSIDLFSRRYLTVQISANTHFPSFDQISHKAIHWKYNILHTILACRSVFVYSYCIDRPHTSLLPPWITELSRSHRSLSCTLVWKIKSPHIIYDPDAIFVF